MSPSTMEAQPCHLAWETSANSTHPTVSDRLPDEVATCLQNARFLHLATCTQNCPHVSLMNYTYLPPHSRPPTSTQLPSGPTIIMTSNPSSKKTLNLISNPNVSLLVHDWVSSRPPNVSSDTSPSRGTRERSPGAGGRGSSLANMLMQMNSAAVSSISATMNGEATVLEPGTEEEKWCKEQHLLNNTFADQVDVVSSAAQQRPVGQQQRALSAVDVSGDGQGFGVSPSDGRAGDGGRGSYIEDEEARVVVVRIMGGRISDWKGGVKDWVIGDADEQVVNGVS